MYCPQCSSYNEDSAGFCASCGADLAAYRQQWGGTSAQSGQQSYQPYGDASQGAPSYSSPMTTPAPGAYQPPAQYSAPGAYQYPSYGYPQYPMGGFSGPVPHIPNHMGLAVTALVLGIFNGFTWIPAVPAMIFASQVDSKTTMGDIAGAQSAARNAQIWGWVSIGLLLLGILLVIIIVAVAAGS